MGSPAQRGRQGERRMKTTNRRGRCGCVLFAGLSLPCMTAAQQSDAPIARHERIEVTGTRIPRAGSEGALPLQVITRQELANGGIESAQDLLDRLSVHQSFGSFTDSVGAASTLAGFSGASLRGLGYARTLVLLNGRRLATYAATGAGTDLSAIPLSALERVEILKDGASAIYGTDAIGGVINFILRRDYRGAEVAGNYFATEHGGGNSWRANATVGWGDLGHDGYNVFLFADHARQDVLRAIDRPSTRTAYIPELAFDRTSETPYRASYPANLAQSPGIRFFRNPTIPVTGASGASCAPPYSFSTAAFPLECRFDPSSTLDAIPLVERTNVIGHVEYRMRAQDSLFAELAYYHGYSRTRSTPIPFATGTVYALPSSSPYYPADFVRDAGGDPTLPVRFQYRFLELGSRTIEATTDQARIVAGVRGTRSDWDYEAALTYATNRQAPTFGSGWLSMERIAPMFLAGAINPFAPNTPEVIDQMGAAQVSGHIIENR